MYELDIVTFLILIGIILLLLVVIAFLIQNKKHKNIKIIETSNPKELENFLKENDLSDDFLNNFKNASNITQTKTVRRVKYVNGQKVLDEIKTTTTDPNQTTFCPNCGAKLDNPTSNTCTYCNQTFIK